MIKNKSNSVFYNWGNNCKGWKLVDTEDLSVIEEEMPVGTSEKLHFHKTAQQLFYILSGKAKFETNDKEFVVARENAFYVLPGNVHRVTNAGTDVLKFIVISQPTTRNDRIET